MRVLGRNQLRPYITQAQYVTLVLSSNESLLIFQVETTLVSSYLVTWFIEQLTGVALQRKERSLVNH